MLDENDELLTEFVTESREGLAEIESDLLAIEACGDEIDLDLVNKVFRAIHSIKGAAGFMGLNTVGSLAHSLENVLVMIRNCELTLNPERTSVLLEGADVLSSMIDDIGNSESVDVSLNVQQLDRIVNGEDGDATTSAELVESSSDVDSSKTPESVDDAPDASDDVQSSRADTEDVEEPTYSEECSQKTTASTTDTKERSPGAPAAEPVAESVSKEPPSKPVSKATGESTPRADANIRVPVPVLDRLMTLAGELVLGRNQLLQTIASNDTQMLDSVGARMDQVTSELQETIMQTRMQPVGTVFNKFTRIVRDLSNMLNKQCLLEINGKDVELDKTIIEAIGDPLTHLIRNSVDHGVESPEVREERGKPACGTVHLRAYHQDGKVNIAISDDGAGIDADKLKLKAIEKGVLTDDKAASMSDAEALRLIFAPGFSTVEKVSSVSGRGVGMDVVKTNFERLGGSVDIDTALGKGTTFTVRLPLTLAIVPSLIVRANGQRFAVPQTNISELVRIRTGDDSKRLEQLRDAEVLRLRGSLLPLVRLSNVLGNSSTELADEESQDTESSTSPRKAATNIIVVEAGNLRYGLIVDSLHDSEEIVVKPLGRHMSDVHFLAGATVLGDGKVALILDITGVAGHIGLSSTDQVEPVDMVNKKDRSGEPIPTLLFTNHPDEQFGVPMGCVSRIERIRTEKIETVAGQEVLHYNDRTLPLITLETSLNTKPRELGDRCFIIVFQAGKREVGLIAPQILDIRDLPCELDTQMFDDEGLLGSLVLDGKATRIVDTYELTLHQHPQWFNNVKPVSQPVVTDESSTETPGQPVILLAEDSAFFRQTVRSYLEQIGTSVVACEDGAIAWETLESLKHSFSIIVTDIEMPKMDGYELTKRVKSDERFRGIPVVALSSLASDEHKLKGAAAGIDEYLTKLNRDQLALTITNLLNHSIPVNVPSALAGVS